LQLSVQDQQHIKRGLVHRRASIHQHGMAQIRMDIILCRTAVPLLRRFVKADLTRCVLHHY
jgi:hypothetical protein